MIYLEFVKLVTRLDFENGSLVKEMFSKDVSSRELESLYLEYMKS